MKPLLSLLGICLLLSGCGDNLYIHTFSLFRLQAADRWSSEYLASEAKIHKINTFKKTPNGFDDLLSSISSRFGDICNENMKKFNKHNSFYKSLELMSKLTKRNNKQVINDAWGTPYFYVALDDGYSFVLGTAGPNKKWDQSIDLESNFVDSLSVGVFNVIKDDFFIKFRYAPETPVVKRLIDNKIKNEYSS